MKRILLMATTVVVLSGCAAPAKQGGAEDHAAHHPAGAATVPAAPKVEQQMKMMREMHQKMQAAKTPQERAALMDEHMKAMRGGMSMMCDMGAGMGAGAQGGAGSKDSMARCMEMKDMATQMMMDREGMKPPTSK
ncbi:MAG: lipoprotein [Pseudomonadota bacterium]